MNTRLSKQNGALEHKRVINRKTMKKPARPSPYATSWPPKYRLFIYEDENGRPNPVADTADRKYDLNDNLFQLETDRTVFLGVEIASPRWPVWDEETVKWIEERITWDLEFDGNKVEVTRHTSELLGRSCTMEFMWKVWART